MEASARPTSTPTPSKKAKKRKIVSAAILGVVVLAGVGGVAAAMAFGGGNEYAQNLATHTVERMDLDVTVRKDGELQAVNSVEVVSLVEGGTTIVELVPEGTFVNAGDVIARLDSSSIERELQETELELQAAQAELINAQEQLEIEKDKVEADISAAQVELTLAEMDLRQYEQGVYPQLEENARTAVEMAEIDLRNAEEELLQTQQLFAKNFVTGADVKKRELAVIQARNKLDEAQTDYDVLTEYTHPKDLTSKRNDLAQKQSALVRTQRQGKASISQREADVKERELRLMNRQERLDFDRAQFEACTIRAPLAGLVVYGSAESRRESDQIAEGSQVRERQTIVRLPDTNKMKAVVKVNESRVGMITPGQKATLSLTASSRPITGTVTNISVVADSGQRWFNPDVREYPVEIVLDSTPQGLKPGMKVQSEIFVDSRDDVVAVPLGAIYTVGAKRYVFIPRADGPAEPREITTGITNATHAEVKDGLTEGEKVVLLQVGQGRELLEAAGIRAVAPPRRGGPAEGNPNQNPENSEGAEGSPPDAGATSGEGIRPAGVDAAPGSGIGGEGRPRADGPRGEGRPRPQGMNGERRGNGAGGNESGGAEGGASDGAGERSERSESAPGTGDSATASE